MGSCSPLFAEVFSFYLCEHWKLRFLACCRVTASEMETKASQICSCNSATEHAERSACV